jgi:hypothetical protein
MTGEGTFVVEIFSTPAPLDFSFTVTTPAR